jgi:hypothetical protein
MLLLAIVEALVLGFALGWGSCWLHRWKKDHWQHSKLREWWLKRKARS